MVIPIDLYYARLHVQTSPEISHGGTILKDSGPLRPRLIILGSKYPGNISELYLGEHFTNRSFLEIHVTVRVNHFEPFL